MPEFGFIRIAKEDVPNQDKIEEMAHLRRLYNITSTPQPDIMDETTRFHLQRDAFNGLGCIHGRIQFKDGLSELG